MKNLIVANWKMNPQTYDEAEDLVKNIVKEVKKISDVDIVICLPFTWLTDFSHKNKSNIIFGAQNCFYEEKGAYTGEISPLMLKNSGVEYVIIGHSERRKYFAETDEIINKKIKAAINVELEQIFCVGETDEERNNNNQEKVVERQIKEGLKDVADILGMVIAYEPVWAIGTGKACGVDDAKKMKEFIEKIISEIYGKDVLNSVRIIYGGSVNSQNSSGYIKEAGYNGLLVGGASLNAEEFVKIVKSAE